MNTILTVILPLHIEILYSYLALDLYKGLDFYKIKNEDHKLQTNVFKNLKHNKLKINTWKPNKQIIKMHNTMSGIKILSFLCFGLPTAWFKILIKGTKSLYLIGFLLIFMYTGILQKPGLAIAHRPANVAQENIRVFLKNKLQG